MPDKFHAFQLVPFMIGLASPLVPSAKVNVTRIIEALIIAMLTAGMVTWRTTAVLTEQVAGLKAQMMLREDEELRRYATISDGMKSLAMDVKENRDLVEDHILEQLRHNKAIDRDFKASKERLDKTLKAPWR